MNNILFYVMGLIPFLLTIGLYFLKRTKFFSRIPMWAQYTIIGVLFGGSGVIATEFGVDMGGAILNFRDASVIIASLGFGWPCGLIAGGIAGVERFISTYWNQSFYTQWACSISTLLSGVVSSMLMKYVFKNKPRWYHGLGFGLALETFHILMIFLTNISDSIRAFSYVEKIGNFMIIGVGLITMFSILFMNIADFFLNKEKKVKTKKMHIYHLVELSLLVGMVVAYTASSLLTYQIQSEKSKQQLKESFVGGIADIESFIKESSDLSILDITRSVKAELENEETLNNGLLTYLAAKYDVAEISYINKDGFIECSSVIDYVYPENFDMHSGEQSKEFLILLEGEVTEYVQEFTPITKDSTIYMKYAGVTLSQGGFVQVGYDFERYYHMMTNIVSVAAHHRTVGNNGFFMISDVNNVIISSNHYEGSVATNIGFEKGFYDYSDGNIHEVVLSIEGEESIYVFESKIADGYYIIPLMSKAESELNQNMSIYITTYFEFLIFAIIFLIIYILIDKLLIKNLVIVNDKLAKIAAGDIDERLEIKGSLEFESLAQSINTTVDTLNGLINEEKGRIDKELLLAKQIQESSLPPKSSFLFRHEFDINATMVTAKEVGGDFYDYFFVDDTHLAILIADVSGKGIPAALFMMRAKSTIKSLSEAKISLEEVFLRANKNLCKNNDNEMFVTSFMAIIDLNTGLVEYVNAGHNPPILRINDRYIFLDTKPNLILGSFAKSKYEKHTLQIHPGDKFFLYTDGVTEAEKDGGEQYTAQRLIKLLSTKKENNDKVIIQNVLDDIARFVQNHPQTDDITMLSFTYQGHVDHHTFLYKAEIMQAEKMFEDINTVMKQHQVPASTIDQIDVCAEEIFSNICIHGQVMDEDVRLILEITEKQISLTFFDKGKKFDPFKRVDPDIHLSAKERPIGGLGLFMVKKIMDNVKYSYQEKHNILVMTKYYKKGE